MTTECVLYLKMERNAAAPEIYCSTGCLSKLMKKKLKSVS